MPEPASPNPQQDPTALSAEGLRMLGAFFDVSLPSQSRTRIGERLLATQPAAALLAAISEGVFNSARQTAVETTSREVQAEFTAAELVANLYQTHPDLRPKIEDTLIEAMRQRASSQFAFAVVEAEGERLRMRLIPACIEQMLDQQDTQTQETLRWALTVIVDRFSTQDLMGASALAGSLLETATRDAKRASIIASMLTNDLGRMYQMQARAAEGEAIPKGVGRTFLAPWGKEIDELVGSSMGLAMTATHALSYVEYGREIVAALESSDSGKQITGLFCLLNGASIVDRDLRARAKVAIEGLTLENEMFVYKAWVAPALEILRGWEDFYGQFGLGREPEE